MSFHPNSAVYVNVKHRDEQSLWRLLEANDDAIGDVALAELTKRHFDKALREATK